MLEPARHGLEDAVDVTQRAVAGVDGVGDDSKTVYTDDLWVM